MEHFEIPTDNKCEQKSKETYNEDQQKQLFDDLRLEQCEQM